MSSSSIVSSSCGGSRRARTRSSKRCAPTAFRGTTSRPHCGTRTRRNVPRMTRRFPDGFTWGTATAAHQIEGNNWNNDWWAWEHNPESGTTEPSGDACDSYHRYADDHAIVADL